MIDRCYQWESRARTVQGRTVVTTSITLSTLWYVLSVLPTHQKEISQIQRAVNHYMNNYKDTHWNEERKWNKINGSWIYISKNNEGWGLNPVTRTLEACRLRLLQQYFIAYERAQAEPHGWITLAMHTTKQTQYGRAMRPDDIKFGTPGNTIQANTPGDLAYMSSWWRKTWTLWLNQ